MGAPEKQEPRKKTGSAGKGSSTSVYLLPGDEKHLKLIQEELGTSVSDAIRTSIRVYAALITQMQRKQRN